VAASLAFDSAAGAVAAAGAVVEAGAAVAAGAAGVGVAGFGWGVVEDVTSGHSGGEAGAPDPRRSRRQAIKAPRIAAIDTMNAVRLISMAVEDM
jgi:hypothetical protein